jgi:hypothetical protein
MNQRNLVDFMNHPITVGDVIAECGGIGIRVGKVLRINEKSLTVTAEYAETTSWRNNNTRKYLKTRGHESLEEGIKDLEKQTGSRNLALAHWRISGDSIPYIINLTALNLVNHEDETSENR